MWVWIERLQIMLCWSKVFTISRGWFRSIDLWVMGPARFRCATLLYIGQQGLENPEFIHCENLRKPGGTKISPRRCSFKNLQEPRVQKFPFCKVEQLVDLDLTFSLVLFQLPCENLVGVPCSTKRKDMSHLCQWMLSLLKHGNLRMDWKATARRSFKNLQEPRVQKVPLASELILVKVVNI